jgi:hypothetical protein
MGNHQIHQVKVIGVSNYVRCPGVSVRSSGHGHPEYGHQIIEFIGRRIRRIHPGHRMIELNMHGSPQVSHRSRRAHWSHRMRNSGYRVIECMGINGGISES